MKRGIRLVLSAVLLVQGISSALEAGFIQTFAEVKTGSIDNTDGGVGVGSAHTSASTNVNGTFSGTADAAASFKHVGIGIHSSAAGPGHLGGFSDGFADAKDSFVVVPTSASGSPIAGISGGTFNVLVDVSFTIDATRANSATASTADLNWEVTVGNQSSSDAHVHTSLSESLLLTVSWTAGAAIDTHLHGGGLTTSGANTADSTSADINFLNSIDWGGITGVFDNQGSRIDHFTALSLDGSTDYATAFAASAPSAVPEPPGVVIAGVGMLGLLTFSVYRKRTGALAVTGVS